MEWYLMVLKKYAQFGGRSRRKEYWMYALIGSIFVILLSIVEGLLGLTGILSGIYSLAVLIPGVAVFVRRLHDTGHSAWWILLGLVPLIGPIVLLVFMVQDSQPGNNEYGPNPKES